METDTHQPHEESVPKTSAGQPVDQCVIPPRSAESEEVVANGSSPEAAGCCKNASQGNMSDETCVKIQAPTQREQGGQEQGDQVEQQSLGGSGSNDQETSSPRPGLVPGLRVQIGSLKNPDIVREARPKPGPEFTWVPRAPQAVVSSPPPPSQAAPPSNRPEMNRPQTAASAPLPQEALAPTITPPKTVSAQPAVSPPSGSFPPPNIRAQLPPDLERELEAAIGGVSLDALLETGTPAEPELEPDSKLQGRVVAVRRESVFLELGGQKQGVLSLVESDSPPAVGDSLDVVVIRFNQEDGLYELARPGAAVEVGDWSQVAEGLIVQAVVTGHNKGGLECTVNNLRGFMPISQIAIYRVDDLAGCVGQSFPVLVMEADGERRNLVLSRRALLEREAAENRQNLLSELVVGQTREGVVRSLHHFGAFVDLGGVDGLIHISQLSWDRVQHPADILTLGQRVRVRIEKMDPQSGKIGLSYRDLAENPWSRAAAKYPVGTRARGTVSKLMPFGAFVKLEPGVEGLIHISELSHQRVWRASDIVQEGSSVEVQVLSVDTQAQRIGLSLKALEARPEPKQAETAVEEEVEEASSPESRASKKPSGPLKGGLGGPSGGEKYGLRW